jgi:hypothetical protein
MADDHQRLIDQVFGYVRDQLAHGGLEFTVLTINENGHRNRLRIDPRFMESGATKDVLMDELRQAFRQQGIVRYVLVAECWMERKLPVPPGPFTRDRLDEFLAEYAKEYERRGLSPDHGGGRDEIIFMHVCDRKRSSLRVWTIDRDPITGAVRDLIAFDDAGPEVAFAGRFVNLLDGEVN